MNRRTIDILNKLNSNVEIKQMVLQPGTEGGTESNSTVDIKETSLQASITPRNAGSKILVIYSANIFAGRTAGTISERVAYQTLWRDTTAGAGEIANGTKLVTQALGQDLGANSANTALSVNAGTWIWMDSPGDVNTHTYTMAIHSSNASNVTVYYYNSSTYTSQMILLELL